MPENNAAAAHTAPSATLPVTNRQFVAMVRARLDAVGHHDIPIERRWIDEETPGLPFLLNVPVGSELVVPLKPRDASFRTWNGADLVSHVDHFAKALATLRKAERILIRYAADVRHAADRMIATARAEGLDVLLAGVTFKPTCASHLTERSWGDAAYHVLASVHIRHTSFYLQPTISEIYVEEPEHVAEELKGILQDQFERQGRLAQLDALGADLLLDASTFDLLQAHVADVGEVLRDVWRKQHVSIPVQVDGYETVLSLTASDGLVESSIGFREAYWDGEQLLPIGQRVENGLDLVGEEPVGEIGHPAPSMHTIAPSGGQPEEELSDLDHPYMRTTLAFDADTGRVWPLEVRPTG